MLKLLYSTGWNENIKIVEVPKPKKKGRDEEVKKPNDHQDPGTNMFDKFFTVEKEIKKAIQVEKETYGNQKVLDRIKGIKKVEGFFEELKEAVV